VALAAVACVIFAALITWPQAQFMASRAGAHQDPRFSMWRLAWIAHALATNPRGLFDANIFHPATNTLAYSDATLLEGLLAAPFLSWGGAPALVYNIELLGAIALSGLAMFVLARRLTGSPHAAIVAAAIFAMAPFRVEHFVHLELQWTMWMPLTWWAVHRAFETGTWRRGVLAGVMLWLQVISCVYYGVFLGMLVAVLVVAIAAMEPRRSLGGLAAMTLAAATTAVLTLPYLRPYVKAARALGPRSPWEIEHYSAKLTSYLAAPSMNYVWGWTDALFGGDEARLFPGLIACVLAAAAVAARPRRHVIAYGVLAVVAIDLSLGPHGILYPFLVSHIAVLKGLRSLARFGILSAAAIAVLAALGFTVLEARLADPARRLAVTLAVIVLMCAEYANRNMPLRPEIKPADVPLARMLRSAPPGPIIELPLPSPSALPGPDADYEYWSTGHWHPLVNGYSGYFTEEYVRTLLVMRTFPDIGSIRRLQSLGVRYVVLHREYYVDVNEFARVTTRIAGYPEDLSPFGRYRDAIGEAAVFTIRQP
jgi:hypothetical protein